MAKLIVLAPLLMCSTPVLPVEPETLPDPLRRLEPYRATHMAKARIEWSLRRFGGARQFSRHTLTLFADGDMAEFFRGDDRGVIGEREDGTPLVGEMVELRQRDGVSWMGTQGPIYFNYWPPGSSSGPYADVRWIDVPIRGSGATDFPYAIRSWFPTDATEPAYETEAEGDIHKVRATIESSDNRYEAEWWLDARHGWCPVRTIGKRNGEVLTESRITPVDFGGVWFPGHIVRYRNNFRDGKMPYEVFRVRHAQFGGDLPDQLTPQDIGVEVGSSILVHGAGPRCWDGHELIDSAEVNRLRRAGEFELSPRLQEALRREEAGEPPVTRPDGDSATAAQQNRLRMWQAYVGDFIQERALSPEQVDSALSILRECERRARDYFAARAERFKELGREIDKPVALADREAREADLRRLRGELDRLLEPVDQIYTDQLKPRLDSLLTTVQREKRDEATATRPVSP